MFMSSQNKYLLSSFTEFDNNGKVSELKTSATQILLSTRSNACAQRTHRNYFTKCCAQPMQTLEKIFLSGEEFPSKSEGGTLWKGGLLPILSRYSDLFFSLSHPLLV